MKVAKIVHVSLMVRVVVDESLSDEQVAEVAKGKLINKINNELHENIEEIYIDFDMPYDKHLDL